MSPIAASDWNRVIDAITSAQSLLLLGHVSPDGDALGSALGAGLAIAAIKLVGNLARPVIMEFVKNRFFYSGGPSRGRK